MTVTQTLLVFVGIPAGIILLIFIAVYGKSIVTQPNRYRPGRAWDFPPSWYVPHPDTMPAQSSAGGQTSTTATGGASGEW